MPCRSSCSSLPTERVSIPSAARSSVPAPNVDSALVAFRRRPLPDDYPAIKRVVQAAFAHRRKTLPNSIELAGVATREQAAAALTAIGLDPGARAEQLLPEQFAELAPLLA